MYIFFSSHNSILNEILHEERFQEDEVSIILNAFPRNPAAAQIASRFVRANWQEIVQRYFKFFHEKKKKFTIQRKRIKLLFWFRFPGSYSVLKSFVLSMVNGLTTEQDLEDVRNY